MTFCFQIIYIAFKNIKIMFCKNTNYPITFRNILLTLTLALMGFLRVSVGIDVEKKRTTRKYKVFYEVP